jgi:lipopolysaccharide biosynthesis regulator YciM
MLFNYDRRMPESVVTGWQALQSNTDDFTARYMVGVGLAQLKDPSAAATIRQSRVQLKNTISRATALLGGLAFAEGDTEGAIRALMEIRKHPDVETYMIISLDSTREPLRSDPEHSSVVQAARVSRHDVGQTARTRGGFGWNVCLSCSPS